MASINQNLSQNSINKIIDRSIVIRMAQQGKSKAEIEYETGFHRHFVRKWMERNSPLDLPRPGRQKSVTQAHSDFIQQQMFCQVGVGYRTVKKKLTQMIKFLTLEQPRLDDM